LIKIFKYLGLDLILAGAMCLSLVLIIYSQYTSYSFLYNSASIFALLYLMIGLCAFAFNYKKLMFVGFGLSAIVCLQLKNASNESLKLPSILTKEDNFSISHYNLSNISDGEKLLEFIDEHHSDIISFQEVTPGINEFLIANITKSHPYNYVNVRIDPFGKSVYSRYPLTKVEEINEELTEDLALTVNINEKNYLIISTYLTPSLSKIGGEAAVKQLDGITKFMGTKDINSKIVLGEFNMVYWSEPIRNFRSKAPITGEIPFEHIFYSDNLDCTTFEELNHKTFGKIGVRGVFQTTEHTIVGSL
jgi:hypothetical protein